MHVLTLYEPSDLSRELDQNYNLSLELKPCVIDTGCS